MRPSPVPTPVEYPASAVVDLSNGEGPRQVDGFSLPERVGSRFASWSEAELSTVTVNLRGGAGEYVVAFLAEPYHRLGRVGVGVALNGRSLGAAQLDPGWRAYQLPFNGGSVVPGRNVLSLHYSKTARPSDLDPASTDIRALSVRFDQIQIAPVTERVQLAFASNDALGLAALGEGWARDPNDRGTGTWTIGSRAQIQFRLVAPSAKPGGSYRLTLTARAPKGALERHVALTFNGAPLGSLSFGETKSTASRDVPAEHVSAKNELWLEFAGLASPAQLDAASKDQRLLGLRVFELEVEVAPLDAPASARVPPDAAAREQVAEAQR